MPNPTTNAEDLPIIALSEDQRFVFDTRGWLLLPGLLTDEQIRAMRDFCYCLKNDPDSIPAHHRSSIGGPLEGDAHLALGVGVLRVEAAMGQHGCQGLHTGAPARWLA